MMKWPSARRNDECGHCLKFHPLVMPVLHNAIGRYVFIYLCAACRLAGDLSGPWHHLPCGKERSQFEKRRADALDLLD